VLSTDELIARFSLEGVSRNPARFDEVKLRWLNGVHIRALPVAELSEQVASFLAGHAHAAAAHDERLTRAVAISQEKLHTLADFWPLTGPLLDGLHDDPKARERWLSEAGRATLTDVREALTRAERFDEPELEGLLRGVVEHRGVKPGDVYQPLRVAISGSTVSPGIFESVALLGREETLRRIDAALAAG
jgi:glutamyl-tRNA synthetase